jgi:hypothetical protein
MILVMTFVFLGARGDLLQNIIFFEDGIDERVTGVEPGILTLILFLRDTLLLLG